jgi:hypothetical protein
MLFDNPRGVSISAKSNVGFNYTKFQTFFFLSVHNNRGLSLKKNYAMHSRTPKNFHYFNFIMLECKAT